MLRRLVAPLICGAINGLAAYTLMLHLGALPLSRNQLAGSLAAVGAASMVVGAWIEQTGKQGERQLELAKFADYYETQLISGAATDPRRMAIKYMEEQVR